MRVFGAGLIVCLGCGAGPSVRAPDAGTGTAMPDAGDAATPVMLAATRGRSWIAVRSDYVYFSRGSDECDTQECALMRIPIAGGEPTVLVPRVAVGGLALDATNIYFVDSLTGTVMRVPVSGGAPVPVAGGADGYHPQSLGLAVDRDNVYWSQNPGGDNCCTLMKTPLSGGPSSVLAANGAWNPVLDESFVYWSTGHDNTLGSIYRAPISGGGRITVLDQVGGNSLAIDDSYVYAASGQVPDGSGLVCDLCLLKIPKSGGEPSLLAALQGLYQGYVALDDTYAYVSAPGFPHEEGRIYKVPLAGGPALILASGQAVPGLLVVHGPNVYWANDGVNTDGYPGSAIMTVSKAGGVPVTNP